MMSSTSFTPQSSEKVLNLEPKKQMENVFVNLIEKYNIIEESNQYCNNCGEILDENYNTTKYILYKKHVFCSDYCLNDGEDNIRMSWRKSSVGKKWLSQNKFKKN